jgi:S1-C subfamily serine protease
MKLINTTLLSLLLAVSSSAAEAKKTTADHLQDVSVTIVSEGRISRGEGSGVIFSRKDKDGNTVNFIWTAAHVIDNLRSERKVIVNGTSRTIVTFKDAKIVKVVRQKGRAVGQLELDAEVIKYSDSEDGHDLALLKVRKLNFVDDTVKFYLDKEIPKLGTDLWHVGSLLGQMGSNSMTDGVYSQTGRLIKSLNKHVFDQTTVAAFPGSSGGGVFLKSDDRYVGMLVRGAGETFNLIVPARRMIVWATKNDIMWALDPNVKMPTDEALAEISIEDVGADFSKEGEERKRKKRAIVHRDYPYLLRIEQKQSIEVK